MLNLKGVEYVSSRLLGSLAWLHQRVARANGFLKLYGLEARLHDALKSLRSGPDLRDPPDASTKPFAAGVQPAGRDLAAVSRC